MLSCSLWHPMVLIKERNFILGIEFVIINFLFCDSLFAIYGRSKALFLDFVSLLGVMFLVHFSRRVAREEKIFSSLCHFVVECSLTIFGRSRYMS